MYIILAMMMIMMNFLLLLNNNIFSYYFSLLFQLLRLKYYQYLLLIQQQLQRNYLFHSWIAQNRANELKRPMPQFRYNVILDDTKNSKTIWSFYLINHCLKIINEVGTALTINLSNRKQQSVSIMMIRHTKYCLVSTNNHSMEVISQCELISCCCVN